MTPWVQLRQAAAAPTTALLAALRAPATQQRTWLRRLLADNADTAFGRAHGFAAIGTFEDYRAAVPRRAPDAFRPFVARMAAGEANVLTCDPVVAFEETGGTASGAKLVPYTAAALAAFRAAVLPWLADLDRRRPGVSGGRAHVTISPATRARRTTPSGVPIGLMSDAAYLGEDLVPALLALLATPPEVGQIADIDAWRIATLRGLVECDDLTFVSIWSPTLLFDLVAALPGVAEEVARGSTPAARRRLAHALSGGAVDTARLWPRLDTISCWADAGSTAFAARLAAAFPHAQLEPKGLLATESAITLPWGGVAGCIPALTSAVLEFVDEAGDCHLADDLDIAACYDIVLTTPGGLWRYDIGDRVECVARDGAVPRLIFRGRSRLVGDQVGEKLDEAFVAAVLAHLAVPAALVGFADRAGYELWLDDADADPVAATAVVEDGLRANPQYAHARDLGQLAPIAASCRPGFWQARHLARARAGHRLGDQKPTALLLDP